MSEKAQIERAIQRLRAQSSVEIKSVRTNAIRLGADELVRACDLELRLRGNLELSAEQAQLAIKQAREVEGRPLRQVIEAAFRSIPARDYEVSLLRTIQRHPGAAFSLIEDEYKRKDTSLVAGHLVYDRFGFFRQFMDAERDQSSILLEKTTNGGRTTWRLKDDAEAVFRLLGVLS